MYTLYILPTRCNFALVVLSELVLELGPGLDWTPHLPLLLHVALLGLDLLRPLVYQHSRLLLGNLLVVVACKNSTPDALHARYMYMYLMYMYMYVYAWGLSDACTAC